MVEPVDPLRRGQLDVLDGAPGLTWFDQLGLVQAVDRFGQGIVVGAAAKKADAVFKMALALRNSAFSRRSFFISADSSVVTPGRAPASTWAWRTHLWTVSAEPVKFSV